MNDEVLFSKHYVLPQTYTSTNALRWLIPRDATEPRLQRMWQGSSGAQYWEDVPVVFEKEETL